MRSIHALFFMPLAVSAGLIAANAHAGTVTEGVWAPTTCGPKPEAPALDLKSADDYNRSVSGVNAYRQNIRTYVDCVIKEANGDIQAVTKAATATQKAAREANEKIAADVKAADEKFK